MLACLETQQILFTNIKLKLKNYNSRKVKNNKLKNQKLKIQLGEADQRADMVVNLPHQIRQRINKENKEVKVI